MRIRPLLTVGASLIAGVLLAINPPTLQGPCGPGPQYDPAALIELVWSASSGAVNYEVQVSMDPQFSFSAIDNYTSSTVLDIFASLSFDAHYYWRVRASDGANWSVWSENCDFYTMPMPAPPAPLLQTPANNSVGLSTTVGLQWSFIPATAIEINVAANAAFTGATVVNTGGQNHTLTGLLTGQTYYWRVRGSNIGGTGPWSEVWTFTTGSAVTTLNLHMLLQGPWNSGTSLMNDGLRTTGTLPAAEPYTALGFTGISNTGASLTPSLLTVNGANAVVDWVLLEVHHATSSAVLGRWAMLVQCDGDLMMPNGAVPSLSFPMGQVRLAVRHRTHLGAMASAVYTVTGTPITVDLASVATPMYGTTPTATVSGFRALWCGDVDHNGTVSYMGTNNDRDPILVRVGGAVPTNVVSGAYAEDVNMDGTVRYMGANNDRDPILMTIGGTVPTASRTAQLP